MKVVISNRNRPDYGQITVPLPIPDEEYDQVIEKLESFEMTATTPRPTSPSARRFAVIGIREQPLL